MASSRKVLKALRKIGFAIDSSRGRGSHSRAKFEHGGTTYLHATIQHGKDIPEGTLQNIRRSIHLSKPEFNRFLRCEMSEREYITILRRRGVLPR